VAKKEEVAAVDAAVSARSRDREERSRDGAAEDAPMPEAAPVIEDYVGEVAVVDPTDRHEVMVAMDAHDVAMLLERAQSSALRKWVYVLPDGTKGLTVHAVQDLIQQMNWSGKARVGIVEGSARFERTTEDAGYGPEPFWVCDVSARDEVTGQLWMGTSSEPVYMRLKQATADRKRKAGARISEDNRVFDPFSRSKALQKAQRNATGAFIPEQVEQAIIAMFENDPSRVERIRTEQEAALEALPAPLDDDEARDLIRKAESVYDEIVWPEARVEFPPGTFAAWKLQAQHSHDRLRDLVAYVEKRRDELAAKYGGAS
jgi:hypothetical protein